ncbi:plasmid stability protein [Nostoc sp. CCCryo 231-06]|nr:plasmid stability protein [Nostoc sp. CCCryo 231-06]
MNNITISKSNLDDHIKSRLQKRAEKHGRSLEEAREILRMALRENHQQPLNLATMLEERFANLGDFELLEIPREPSRSGSTLFMH